MQKAARRIQFKKGYILVYSKSIVRFLGRLVSLGSNAMALGFWPFIFIRPDLQDKPVFEELLRHEVIHIRQQRELLVIGAWLLYGIEYLYARFIKKFDKRQAYYYTSLEQEAHRNAMKPDYLEKRKLFATFKYLKDKKWLGRTEGGELIEREYS